MAASTAIQRPSATKSMAPVAPAISASCTSSPLRETLPAQDVKPSIAISEKRQRRMTAATIRRLMASKSASFESAVNALISVPT